MVIVAAVMYRGSLMARSRLAGPINRPDVKKMPARQFPVQREIQKLEEELNAFKERIAELEGEPASRSCDGSVESKCDGFCSPD